MNRRTFLKMTTVGTGCVAFSATPLVASAANQMKFLDRLRWHPTWTSHLGCVKGCLDFLGIEVSEAWLYGATGHAFLININKQANAAGPTAWNTEMLFKLGRNLGYTAEALHLPGSGEITASEDRNEMIWNHVQRRLDEGIPCYGASLFIPEYYVVYGYDEVGYHYSGVGTTGENILSVDGSARAALDRKEIPETVRLAFHEQGIPLGADAVTLRRLGWWVIDDPESGQKYEVIQHLDNNTLGFAIWCVGSKEPKPWREYGVNGWVEMYAVRATGQAADDRTTVKEALAFALEHAQSSNKWTFPDYASGLAGYKYWIDAMENRTAGAHGVAYNAAVWGECRELAVEFLKEAKDRLDGPSDTLYEEAIRYYHTVAQHLRSVADALPFLYLNHLRGELKDLIHNEDRRQAALTHLKAASEAEKYALAALERLYWAI